MADSPIQTERIEQEVRAALATTLRVDPQAIDVNASIMKSLNATSIDFLDINFRLETTFGVTLATQLLLDHVEEELGEGVAIDRDNRISAPAARLLQMNLGEVEGLQAGLYADEVPSLVTPSVLIKSLRGILDHLPDTCSACQASSWKSDDGCKVVCGGCGADAQYPDGDELTKAWIRQVEDEHHLFASA